MMHYEFIATVDQTHIAYQTSLPISPHDTSSTFESCDSRVAPLPLLDGEYQRRGDPKVEPAQTNPLASKCILLMHGFSGSSQYFVKNYDALSQQAWIIAPDMRGHGYSQQTPDGHTVTQLAADLRDLVKHIRSLRPGVEIFPVGCSIGAAVLWTYIEIFGNQIPDANKAEETDHAAANEPAFHGMVFVDQAPLQDRSSVDDWDESKAHYGLYDEKTLLAAQSSWGSDDLNTRQEAHKGLVASCLGYRAFPEPADNITKDKLQEDERFFTEISARCNGKWLARLMADHTKYDHRKAIEAIDVPVLVMAGKRSGCFPLEGMLEIVRRVSKGKSKEIANISVFDTGHWLFYEQPERFNREIIDFIQG